MQRNSPNQSIGAQLVNATTGAAFTGAVTVAVTGDSGTQATGSVGAGACTHEGNGYHSYRPAQAETNYAHVAFTFTGTGAIPVTVQIFTSFPQSGDAFTRLPTALTGAGNMKADLLALNGSAPAAVNLAAAHLAYLTGTVTDATPAAGDFQGDLALSPTDNFYQFALLAFTSGPLQGLARQISTYDGDTRQFLFTGTGENADAPFPASPANGDTFMLIGRIGT